MYHICTYVYMYHICVMCIICILKKLFKLDKTSDQREFWRLLR